MGVVGYRTTLECGSSCLALSRDSLRALPNSWAALGRPLHATLGRCGTLGRRLALACSCREDLGLYSLLCAHDLRLEVM